VKYQHLIISSFKDTGTLRNIASTEEMYGLELANIEVENVPSW